MQRNGNILIVDDIELNRQILKDFLEKENYTVILAHDGEEALDIVYKDPPDIILLDIVMPKISGFEVCQTLKNDEKTRLIPIIFISQLDKEKDNIKGIEMGVDDFITKPFNENFLKARVKSLLRMKFLNDQLENSENVIFTLAKAVEAKDAYTEGHIERVSNLAVSLGRKIGLSSEMQIALKKAGILHDIGKIGITDYILNKKEPLTREEFNKLMQHPIIGVRICEPLNSINYLLPIIRSHHEKLDGSGYPDGLKGDQIPITARILTIVDIFDALTTNRPYRAAMPNARAFQIMQEEASKGWWDKDIINSFIELISSTKNK